MALKTQPTEADVEAFLDAIPDAQKREDSRAVCRLLAEVTGQPPVMWGTSIVGFGTYHYKSASGREGDWMALGFAPRKQALTLYLMDGFDGLRRDAAAQPAACGNAATRPAREVVRCTVEAAGSAERGDVGTCRQLPRQDAVAAVASAHRAERRESTLSAATPPRARPACERRARGPPLTTAARADPLPTPPGRAGARSPPRGCRPSRAGC